MSNLGTAVAVGFLALVAGCDFIDVGGPGGSSAGLTQFNEGFAFIRQDDGNVYLTDRADGFQAVMPLSTTGGNRNPSLSRDGRNIAYIHVEAGASELRVISPGQTESSLVLASDSTRRDFRNPVFSVDGAFIAFSFEAGGRSRIGTVNVDGSGFSEFGDNTLSLASPTFYPDGRSVLVMSGDSLSGFTRLEKLDLTSGSLLNMVSSLGDVVRIANRAVLSPGGTRVAFDGLLGSGASRVFVVDFDAKSLQQLTDYPGDPAARDSFPAWVGNSEVAFNNNIGSEDQLYAISATAQLSTGTFLRGLAVEAWYGP